MQQTAPTFRQRTKYISKHTSSSKLPIKHANENAF